MKTVKQISELTGISVRTLQYYDQIGLLNPTSKSEAGYRLYEEEDMDKLQQILFFRELDFPLKEIKAIMENPRFDKMEAYHKQKELLKAKYERIGSLITLLEKLEKGEKCMDSFKEFGLGEYFNALQVFQENNKEEIIKQWGSMEAFQNMVEHMKQNEENVAKSAIEWYGSVGKYTEAMKDNLNHFSEKMQKVEELKKNGYIQETTEKGQQLRDLLVKDMTKEVSSEQVQNIVKQMVSLTIESAHTMGETIGDNYWKAIIHLYLKSEATIQTIDKLYTPGASVYIGKALQYYFDNQNKKE